jgi:group I intron endonuclease
MACIYQIKNLVNDKFYIGSTIRALYIRKYEHLSELRNNEHCNTYLQRSFNKYGEQNFSFKILEILQFPNTYSKLHKVEYLVCRELYLVDLLNAEYNIRKDSTTGKTGYTHSEETLKKMADTRSKKPLSKTAILRKDIEQRRLEGKLYCVRNGKGRGSRKEWKHTSESIEKIRERSSREDNITRLKEIQKITAKNRIGQHLSEERKIKSMTTKFGTMRQIEIYKDTELLYNCNFSSQASLLTGVKRATIANNLAGLSKSAGGYVFTYKNIN